MFLNRMVENSEQCKGMRNSTELRKFLAPEFVYGVGALGLAGRYARSLGATKLLIVTDPGVRAAGWTKAVERSVREAGISYAVFDDVTSNPKDYEVMAGVDVYKAEKCDLILSVGGGSPTDCAKGIGICVGNGEHILHYGGINAVPAPGPPLVCVPTTAGTSADLSQFTIITDTAQKRKIAIVSKTIVPDASLIDPQTTKTMPAALTAGTGMDCLCHAFEAYASTLSSPVTDINALESVRLVSRNLAGAYAHPASMEYRDGMMMASLTAGLAFSNASLGLVHAMAHSLGGLFDAAHGECNAILLEHVVRFNYEAAPERYARLAQALGINIRSLSGGQICDALADWLSALRHSLDLTQSLGQFGVERASLAIWLSAPYRISVWRPIRVQQPWKTLRRSMKTLSNTAEEAASIRQKLLDSGLESMRKSYYPQLQAQLKELRESERFLQEKSQALLKMVGELEQAGREIQKREARFRALIETAPVVILMVDAEGHILEFNSEAERVYGRSREYALGKNYFELFLEEGVRDQVVAEVRRILAGQPSRGYENAIRTAAGEQRVFDWNADRLVDERGQVIGVVAVGQETTARKRAEEEALKLNEELEKRVANRTSELEAANTELQAFTSMVSHDLRSPLRGISSYLKILRDSTSSVLDEENKTYLDRSLQGAARMDSLISDLLAFSRAARAEITRTSFDLGALVAEVQQELEAECEHRTICWEIEGLPVVQADRALLHQVLINLLSNALKYGKTRAETRIQIGARATGSEQEIFVRDNGVGFDPRYVDRLFKPFARLHSEREFAGSGIGLATVARIIRRHGGRVWAEGALGQGACFYFTLPT